LKSICAILSFKGVIFIVITTKQGSGRLSGRQDGRQAGSKSDSDCVGVEK
jgi:hypothetical protein